MAARDVAFVHRKKPRADVVHRVKPRVGRAGLAGALGAEEAARVPEGPDTPAGFVALRAEVFRRLRSTGGRPGLAGAERRKIPVTDAGWSAAALAARDMAAPGFRPSPAQVAAVVLDIALRDMPRLAGKAERELRLVGDAAADAPEAGAD